MDKKLQCNKQCSICYNESCTYREQEPAMSKDDAIKAMNELQVKIDKFINSNECSKIKAIFKKYKSPLDINREDRKVIKKILNDFSLNKEATPLIMAMLADYK